MRTFLLGALCLCTSLGFAQNSSTSYPTASNALKWVDANNKRAYRNNTSLLKNMELDLIGPSVMSGRVVDIDVNPERPTEFYVAYASGGLWFTQDNGISFDPVMDNAPTQNIGDIAVDWKNNVIWVGTGENNSSRSSYAGMGMLRSADGGKSWEFRGLPDGHHIGRILLNPENPDEVVVGVTGHLYSKNRERGIFRTTDGGSNWTQTLYINDESGIIDLAMEPGNFKVMYAASWQKDRKAWNFAGNGNGSGIYKSTDAGQTWERISKPDSGLPTGEGVGRIGLAVYDARTVYAVIDNQFRRPEDKKKRKKEGLSKDDFRTMSRENFLKLADKELNDFLKNNGFQEKYRAANVKQMVREGSVQPNDLVSYLEDANSLLFDTPVIGAEVYRSDDGGMSWNKTHDDYIDDLFYSYGYYFAQVRVDPQNKDQIYLAGVPLIHSKDGGKTFSSISKENVHADHHALWINPNQSGHLINGNDGGVNISYTNGKHWMKNNSPAVGQFYAINVDNEKPYNVYGGLQDNGVWKAAHTANEDSRWHQSGHNPWTSIMGGDGMQVEIDPRNSNIVYTGFQFGNYFRLDLESGKRKRLQIKHKLGESPYRFNWQTPIRLSKHNPDVVYFGGNKLHRSLDRGDSWTTISEDLTRGGRKGNVAYGTLTTISESPFVFGRLYTGSDDGKLYTSPDGGYTWQDISSGLPQEYWISEVMASNHKKSRVYVTINGYRWDDFAPHVYRSDDYGRTWNALHQNLPLGAVNAFIEDPVNEDLLFVGTDIGLFGSLDGGENWQQMSNGMPAVAVHDLVIQKEAADLVVGTHGRSIYRVSIKNLQQHAKTEGKAMHVFTPASTRFSRNWGNSWSQWGEAFEPSALFTYYSAEPQSLQLQIKAENGSLVYEGKLDADQGYNQMKYGLHFSDAGYKNWRKAKGDEVKAAKNGVRYLPKGSYTVQVIKDKESDTAMLEIK